MYAVALADVDLDGDLDLAVGRFMQQNELYENVDGAFGAERVWEESSADGTTSLAWGDIDRNGAPDLVIGSSTSYERMYRGGSLDLGPPAWESTDLETTWKVALGDLDGDGFLELARALTDGANDVIDNHGGQLGEPEWQELTSFHHDSRALAVGDSDGDGLLDLAAGAYAWEYADRVYLGSTSEPCGLEQGAGWTAEPISNGQHDQTQALAWADFDGDGGLDLTVGSEQTRDTRIWGSTGLGLADGWASIEPLDAVAVALADADGDGLLEVAVAVDGTGREAVFEGGLGGPATSPTWLAADSLDAHDVAWGDADADGDLDLAVAHASGASVFRWDAAAGTLEAEPVWSITGYASCVEFVDVDDDRVMELVICRAGVSTTRIHEWVGSAYDDGQAITDLQGAVDVAAADLDGDQLPELIFACGSYGSRGPGRRVAG